MITDDANMSVCKITDFVAPKNKNCCIYWKYISPYCEEYRLFNSDVK